MTNTPTCYECDDPIPGGEPMTQVRHGFSNGDTLATIDGTLDVDYTVAYHAHCYADSVLDYVPDENKKKNKSKNETESRSGLLSRFL